MVPHERPRIAGVTRSRKSRGKEPEKTLSVFIGREDVSPLNATSNDVEEERCGRETGFAGHFVNIYLALCPSMLLDAELDVAVQSRPIAAVIAETAASVRLSRHAGNQTSPVLQSVEWDRYDGRMLLIRLL